MSGKILFPDETILETKLFNVGQDWEVPIPGFFIVAPRRKVRSLSDFTDEEAVQFVIIVRKIRK